MAAHPSAPVRSRIAHAAIALAVLVVVGACGGGGADGDGATIDVNRPYNNLALTRPSELPAAEGGGAGGSASNGGDSGSGLVTGADFRRDLLAESVTISNTSARFSPNWTSSTPLAQRRLAAAFYFVDMNQATVGEGAPAFRLNWATPPQSDNLWVGVADFDENRWVWRKLADVSELQLSSRSRFQRGSDGFMACVLLVLGGRECTLNNIDAAASEQEGFINAGYPLGSNLQGLSDWSTSLPYTDVFKTSRDWIPQLVGTSNPWNTGAPVITDSNGWVTSLSPGEAVMTMMMTSLDDAMPTGRYVCLYEGDAGTNADAIKISGAGTMVTSSWTPGRFEINVTNTSSSLFLKIEAINPSDYIRNIRVIMPGFEQTYDGEDLFNPTFRYSLAPFRVLRFMDWGQTNDSTLTTWSSRPGSQYCRYTTERGAPIEAMIALCNRTQKDMWYCVPHLADDQYVSRAVELIRDQLDPRLRLFLEFSNEVWNQQFDQAVWAYQQGILIWPGDWAAGHKFYGRRAAQVMDVATEVFTGEQPGRLIRVLASQSQNPGVGLACMDVDVAEPGDPAHGHADALAVAPYLGNSLGQVQNEATTMAMSVDDVLDFLESDSLLKNGPDGVTSINRANSNARGLALLTYEGGQHLVGVGSVVNNQVITDLFIAVNRHPRMRQIYQADMTRWTERGGGLYMAFTHTYRPSKYGSWGLLESIRQPRQTAYKWLGVHDWLETVWTP